jgi:hypothetical protein
MVPKMLYGQFLPALNNDHISGVNVTPFNTGNDILDDGSDTYRVTCFTDGSGTYTPGITWDVHYSGSNYLLSIPFSLSSLTNPINIFFADVCLVKDPNGVVHAVTAWYVTTMGGNGWEIEDFQWTGTGFTSNGLTYLGAGTAGTAVNIDSDNNGSFVAVYDDNLTNIYVSTGNFSGSTINVSNAGTPLPLAAQGAFPDVCLYFNYPTETVHETFVDAINGDLVVDDYDFPTLNGGVVSPSSPHILDASPTYNGYAHPRIACPTSSGALTDWTIVVEDFSHYNNYILGFNNTTGTTPIIYNDGSIISGATFSLPNYLPVVTYDTHSYVWVGWNIDLRPTGLYSAASAQFPIVVACDKYSYPTIISPNSGLLYYEVPTTPISTNDNEYLLSLSGRFATDLYQSYYDANILDIKSKWINTNYVPNLRVDNKIVDLGQIGITNFLSNEPSDRLFSFAIYNVTGSLILKTEGDKTKIQHIIKNGFSKTQPSVFFANITSDDGKEHYAGKFLSDN